MSETFVEIIGYQLEKVHTGVIAWLLDCKSSPLPLSERTAVISNLAPDLLQGGGLRKITAIREYSFGRRRRIDLVVEMDRNDEETIYLLIECKTDSDVSLEQLKQSQIAFNKRKPNANFSVISLAVGAGQFTINHIVQHFRERGFRTIDLDCALCIFSNLPIPHRHRIYHEWIASLEAEKIRTDEIDKVFQSLDDPRRDPLLPQGWV